jgi:hypothetical protein
MRRFLLLLLFVGFTGCAPQLQFGPPPATGLAEQSPSMTPGSRVPGLHVTTDDNGSLLFHRNHWQLTMTGIRGTADVFPADGSSYTTDTTLSYLDAASASPTGRSTTMGQFMLTLLGVILVIGLAAVILYAAFLATNR